MGYESKSTGRYEYAQICGDITFYITNANGNLTTNVQTSVNNANN